MKYSPPSRKSRCGFFQIIVNIDLLFLTKKLDGNSENNFIYMILNAKNLNIQNVKIGIFGSKASIYI